VADEEAHERVYQLKKKRWVCLAPKKIWVNLSILFLFYFEIRSLVVKHGTWMLFSRMWGDIKGGNGKKGSSACIALVLFSAFPLFILCPSEFL
jgi:hypothetical protein